MSLALFIVGRNRSKELHSHNIKIGFLKLNECTVKEIDN